MNAQLEAGPSESRPRQYNPRWRRARRDNTVIPPSTPRNTRDNTNTNNSTNTGRAAAKWKGKGRANDLQLGRRDEGSGGADGIVLPLTMVGSGFLDAAYTIPIRFGDGQQELLLQVDTGSSDMWVAARSCKNPRCKQAGGKVYDPSSSTPTGQDFEIQYIQGTVSGPVVWESVELGGYSIGNQALAAASDVEDEPLSPHFSGILGLALPLNSIIAATITPMENDTPDGAAFAANLFGITPVSNAPASHFYSLSLARPDSRYPSSLLGIGRHPTEFIKTPKDLDKIKYVTLISEKAGILFWKTSVRSIDVWVNGEKKSVDLGRGTGGSLWPSAVLDSGVPLVLTTSHIANGIYGAIGIGPSEDGKYYVPCTTPLNVSISFENNLTIPLHPLDLTASSPNDFCTGLVQSADGVLGHPTSVGDIILGVPFLRNAYTVMTYSEPDEDGQIISAHRAPIKPSLGLLPITDPVKALDEFNTVRVLNKPLPGGKTDGVDKDGVAGSRGAGLADGKKGISAGIIVLIAILGFLALCAALFGIRWVTAKRKTSRFGSSSKGGAAGIGGLWGFGKGNETNYELGAVREVSGVGLGGGQVSEDELRRRRYEAYLARKKIEEGDFGLGSRGSEGRYPSYYNDDSTKVGRESKYDDPWDPTTAFEWQEGGQGQRLSDGSEDDLRGRRPSVLPDSPTIHGSGGGGDHGRTLSLSATPLLVPQLERSLSGPEIQARSPHSHYDSSGDHPGSTTGEAITRVRSQSPRSTLRNSYYIPEDGTAVLTGPAGGVEHPSHRTSMAGIGTAAARASYHSEFVGRRPSTRSTASPPSLRDDQRI